MKFNKIVLVGFLILFVFVIGAALVLSSQDSTTVQNPLGEDVVLVEPQTYDLGDVVMKNGVVTREYKVKNNSNQTIKLKRIVTSCMCTQAKIKVADRESRLFGMEGHGDRNAPVNIEIASGQEGLVTAIFDPAAHGPTGVGPFDRVVTLTFSDPAGIVDLKFFGKVI